jgi:hypothetical protein
MFLTEIVSMKVPSDWPCVTIQFFFLDDLVTHKGLICEIKLCHNTLLDVRNQIFGHLTPPDDADMLPTGLHGALRGVPLPPPPPPSFLSFYPPSSRPSLSSSPPPVVATSVVIIVRRRHNRPSQSPTSPPPTITTWSGYINNVVTKEAAGWACRLHLI